MAILNDGIALASASFPWSGMFAVFQDLASPLQSNNLTAAQQAFSNLQPDAIEGAGIGGYHLHQHGGGGQVQSSSSSNNVPDSRYNNSPSSNSNSGSNSSNSQSADQLDPLNLLP